MDNSKKWVMVGLTLRWRAVGVALVLATAGCGASEAAAPVTRTVTETATPTTEPAVNGHDAVACRTVGKIVKRMDNLTGIAWTDEAAKIGKVDVADASPEIRNAIWNLSDDYTALIKGNSDRDAKKVVTAEQKLSDLCASHGGQSFD